MQGENSTPEGMEKWRDWKWQMRNTIHSVDTVEKIFDIKLDKEQRALIEETIEKFPMAITPYYLSLVDPEDPWSDPVFKQAFPDRKELYVAKTDMEDPLHEDKDSPVPGVTHRYPDRVLLHVSNTCAMYCRHCTRKRKVGDRDSIPSREQIQEGLDYIRNTPVIRDVLLSGGDPFLLSDEYLDWILTEVSKIPHVEVIRIGTRTPVVLPYRITDGLVEVLKKHENLWINTHFNHPREITSSSKKALKKLWSSGIPLGNQSVLLADINDCPRIMKELVHQLVRNRVRPYYLYQCDLSEGLEHFRTSIGKGIEIMESLRGHTSGFAVPTYVVDAPGGGGKIPVGPNYLISWSTNKAILRNFEGVITTYQEPTEYKHNLCDLNCDKCTLQLKLEGADEEQAIGIQRLLSDYDDMITLTPSSLEKRKEGRWEEYKTNEDI
ncbi:lysine 2,3-aminomutase [Clostridiales bacterium F-3ap]|uniref:L-lysine 2,3-aminomutase n=2 Tax=Anaerotalea alkaliphila TaxID=2662126 RepID=A0A7X5HU15_9FIRM|nr:lysine 2,3-aminomutase [Anaerotalea alkaliphila]NDL66639.1 lysine 2,3-aminomutase [Anaerotalea alkaliphila]